ncbi:MAG: hypothetical protein IT326_02465, partial [Anaerolineae bacterium]|nr:hypothetical protein [Anaerolineae bacterium]
MAEITSKAKGNNLERIRPWLDAALFAAFVIAMAPRFSGLAVHEWLSLALAAAVVCHLLLNWNWIVAVTRRFLDSTPWRVRLS